MNILLKRKQFISLVVLEGDLGYDGINGERASESIAFMKKALRLIGEVINFDFEKWFE